jgi:hypothetical protein
MAVRARRAREDAPAASRAGPGPRYAGPLAPRAVFYTRFRRGAGWALGLVAATLAIGVLGYRELEHLSWLDAFHQAAMLLSGMGPVVDMKSAPGKVFDAVYALFCGVVLLAATGLLFAPVFHRLMHRFHLEDARDR